MSETLTIIEVAETLKAIIFDFIRGATEQLPVSGTGYMILLNEFLSLRRSSGFMELFFAVIQFRSILIAPLSYWKRVVPWTSKGDFCLRPDTLLLQGKIVTVCISMSVAVPLWNDKVNNLFYHPYVVVIILIVVGTLFLVVEVRKREPVVHVAVKLTWRAALWIGFFQMIATVSPGTPWSDATITGASMIGVSHISTVEFTSIMAVPVMMGVNLFRIL